MLNSAKGGMGRGSRRYKEMDLGITSGSSLIFLVPADPGVGGFWGGGWLVGGV